MIRDITQLANTSFDLIVVGGGINGAAIAYLAASRGAKVALLEKQDFAGGTSSKSTKLLHGGIRYLENFEFDLVQESLRERYIQWQALPNLVNPLPFVVPVYKHDERPLWMMKLGVWFYDFLSGAHRIGQHRFLSKDEIIGLAPGINQDGLLGGVEYFDAQMNDARICLENVLMADVFGARVANYVEVKDFIKDNGNTVGVKVKDLLGGTSFEIKATQVIVAAGPWSDEIIQKDTEQISRRLRPTKGVHIVYRGKISTHAFLLQSHRDKRIFFVIPFKGNTLIGTTDTDYVQNPDSVQCEPKDIDYLLKEAGRVFPHIEFDASKIIMTFAGIRPLVAEKGSPSKISRKHAIEKTRSGIYFVMGGKYTTYRAIAQETLLKAAPAYATSKPLVGKYILYGSETKPQDLQSIAQRFGVSMDVVKYLQGIYGSRLEDVLKITQREPKYKEKICTCSPAILAQVVYSREVEMAMKPEDILERRLGLTFLDCPTGNCRRVIADFCK